MMTTLVYLSMAIAAAFLTAATIKRRALPDSISAIVYDLPHTWQWFWTVWMWAVAITVGIPLIDVLPDNLQLFGFAKMTLLCFVGAMPLVRHESNTAHYILAIIAGFLSQVCVLAVSPAWLLTWLLMVVVYVDKRLSRTALADKAVLLSELICAGTLYGALLQSIN